MAESHRSEDRAMTVRPASSGDCWLVFGWRNDPFIVSRGSLQKKVSREEHAKWFAESLALPQNRMLYIIEEAGNAIGLVRFDRETSEQRATVSIYVMEPHTRKGIGPAAIEAGCEAVARRWNISEILACVRVDNPSGIRAFEKSGFAAWPEAPCPPAHTGFRLQRG
jgi:RimJ/RimL family protein N-acetyltransferase